MGETGPCGPCSEIHFDLTPKGDTQGKLVNQGDARCIEFWNLVFIQFNATPEGKFISLPACHVDTGMGFERVASLIQGTKNFQTFDRLASNYDTDIFQPIFGELEKLCGKKYQGTLPKVDATTATDQEKVDVAFRVIADHIRTLSFAIADGIIPSNEGRGYVLRRILRRATRYGRDLGIKNTFLAKLVFILVEQMGSVFPELRTNQVQVRTTLQNEEESFNRTLDRGIALFQEVLAKLKRGEIFPGKIAFELYDTYGFPLDLTELMTREVNVEIDKKEFDELMEIQRKRSQAAQKKATILVEEKLEENFRRTLFVGYEKLEKESCIVAIKDKFFAVEQTPFYAEMGGQVGDQGWAETFGASVQVLNTHRSAQGVFWHELPQFIPWRVGEKIQLCVDEELRHLIQGHHSGTHLLHWALREELGDSVRQKGSYVGADRLRFDFSYHAAVEPEKLREIEVKINRSVEKSDPVKWYEERYEKVKSDPAILQFFGEKYSETVRVVDIGGFSKELCAGTHVKNTREIGFFKIISEGAIASGVRRIEAIAGDAVLNYVKEESKKQEERFNVLQRKKPQLQPLTSVDLKTFPKEVWRQYEAREKELQRLGEEVKDWEREQQKTELLHLQKEASELAKEIIAESKNQKACVKNLGKKTGKLLPLIIDVVKNQLNQPLLLASEYEGRIHLMLWVPQNLMQKFNAGKVIQTIMPLVGGKGGGRADLAQGSGTQVEGISQALERAKELLS